MKKNIAIVAGGDSSEIVISLKMVKRNALILLISPSMELRARTDDCKVIST